MVRRYLMNLLLVAVLAVVGCGKGPSAGTRTVKLAAILPISGPNAAAGNEMANALRLAVDQWNREGNLPGYNIELLTLDDASDPKQAVNAAYKVVGDRDVFAVASHFNSGCFLPASSVYHDAGLLAMTPAATNPKITLQGYPNIFRIVTTDLVQGEKAVQFMKERGIKNIAIIHDRTQYGQGIAEVVRDNAGKQGIEVVSFDGINVGDKDFQTLLAQIKAGNPQVIYFGGLFREGGLIVRQMRELGIESEFWGPDGVKGKDFIDIAGDYASGAIVSFVGQPVNKMPGAEKFLTVYREKYGKDVENYGPYSYEVGNLLLTALKEVIAEKGSWDRQSLVDKVRSMEYRGILGTTRFDKNGDTLNKLISFYQVKEGKFVWLKTLN